MRTQPAVSAESSASSSAANSYGSGLYKGFVLALLFGSYALYALDRSIILVLVEPIKKELGLSDSEMGIITGPAFSLCFALCGIPLGILADRKSRRAIVAACVALWSLATGACGAASTFVQMLLGRVVVGGAVSGAPPAAMSIISDIYPPERRATAISIYYVGGAAGAVIAFGAGAVIAANYGWRMALYLAAIPGILLALLIMLFMREPERGASERKPQAEGEKTSIRETLRFIWQQKSAIHMLAGLMCLHAVGNGGMAFFSSFMIRSHGLTLAETGKLISLLYVLATPVSQIAAGILADRLGQKDVRWRIRMGWMGSVGSLIAITSMMLVGSTLGMAIAFTCWAFSTGLYQAPIYALLQTLVTPRMRGTIGSIQFVFTSAIGGAVGPLFVGTLSDALAPRFGVESLRYALLALGMLYAWAAFHFVFGERHLRADAERVAELSR